MPAHGPINILILYANHARSRVFLSHSGVGWFTGVLMRLLVVRPPPPLLVSAFRAELAGAVRCVSPVAGRPHFRRPLHCLHLLHRASFASASPAPRPLLPLRRSGLPSATCACDPVAAHAASVLSRSSRATPVGLLSSVSAALRRAPATTHRHVLHLFVLPPCTAAPLRGPHGLSLAQA